jgi:hypothetical protein
VRRDTPPARHKIIGNLFLAIDGVVKSPDKWSLSDGTMTSGNVVIVGRGKRLAEGDGEHLPLELVKSTAFENGVIHQLYRPPSS